MSAVYRAYITRLLRHFGTALKPRNKYIQLRSFDPFTYALVQFFSPLTWMVIFSTCGGLFILLAYKLNVLHDIVAYDKKYEAWAAIGYLRNISWSFSMLVLFPLIVGAIAYYYRLIPEFIDKLLDGAADLDVCKKFEIAAEQCLNRRWYPFIVFVISISVQFLYFQELEDRNAWVWKQSLFDHGQLPTTRSSDSTSIIGDFARILSHLNVLGWCAASIQIVLAMIFGTFLFRATALAKWLHALYHDNRYKKEPDPFHPDGVCGLAHVREIIIAANFAVFLLGMYISLYFYDKIVVQKESKDLTAIFMFISMYALSVFALLAESTTAAHARMRKAKEKCLQPLLNMIKHEAASLTTQASPPNDPTERLMKLRASYHELVQDIPEWPLNLKSAKDFLQSVALALAPVLVTLGTHLLTSLGVIGKK